MQVWAETNNNNNSNNNNDYNYSRYSHGADVHGANMLVVMVMNADGEGMAGLVQPVYMDSLANRSQAQPVLCNNSAL